jgi:hypothetical protein
LQFACGNDKGAAPLGSKSQPPPKALRPRFFEEPTPFLSLPAASCKVTRKSPNSALHKAFFQLDKMPFLRTLFKKKLFTSVI